MISLRPVPGNIPLVLKQAIRSGDSINIRVIKELGNGFWRASVKGKIFRLRSEIPLQVGKQYPVTAVKNGSSLLLRMIEDNSYSGYNGDSRSYQPLVREIVDGLLRSSLPVTDVFIQRLAEKLKRLQRTDLKTIRLVILSMDKQLDIGEEAIDSILPDYNNQRHHKRQQNPQNQKDKHDEMDQKEQLKLFADSIRQQTLRKTQDPHSPLQIFNHLQAHHENWIIIPFQVEYQRRNANGSIQLKTDKRSSLQKEFTVTVNIDNVTWNFAVYPAEKKSRGMKIICSEEGRIKSARKKLNDFSKKLKKFGIKIDDSIKRGEKFDGFSVSKTPFKSIDTII